MNESSAGYWHRYVQVSFCLFVSFFKLYLSEREQELGAGRGRSSILAEQGVWLGHLTDWTTQAAWDVHISQVSMYDSSLWLRQRWTLTKSHIIFIWTHTSLALRWSHVTTVFRILWTEVVCVTSGLASAPLPGDVLVLFSVCWNAEGPLEEPGTPHCGGVTVWRGGGSSESTLS